MTDDERKKKLSRWIRRNLAEHNLTQSELACLVSVTPGTLSAWLHRKQAPHPRNLAKLEAVFGERFTGDAKPTPVALQGRGCENCENDDECLARALRGWPVLCEKPCRDDLLIAKHREVLDEVIWWREVDAEKSVEGLAKELEANMVSW